MLWFLLVLLAVAPVPASAQVGFVACSGGYVCPQPSQQCGIESNACRCVFGYFPSLVDGQLVCTQANVYQNRTSFVAGSADFIYLRRDYGSSSGNPVANETFYLASPFTGACDDVGFSIYTNDQHGIVTTNLISTGCYCMPSFKPAPGYHCVNNTARSQCELQYGMIPRANRPDGAPCDPWYQGFVATVVMTIWVIEPVCDRYTKWPLVCEVAPFQVYAGIDNANNRLQCVNGTRTMLMDVYVVDLTDHARFPAHNWFECVDSACDPNNTCIAHDSDYNEIYPPLAMLTNTYGQAVAGCPNELTYLVGTQVGLIYLGGNNTCMFCNQSCEAGYEQCVANHCVCKDHYTRDLATGLCNPPSCPVGLYSVHCNVTCPVCSATGSVCQLNGLQSASCVCSNTTQLMDLLGATCTNQHCGVNRTNLCSGHGECISGSQYEFCMCDRGRDGLFCEQAQTHYDECDCSSRWSDSRVVDATRPLPSGLYLLTDCSGSTFCPKPGYLANDGFVGDGTVLVGSAEQAKYLCYRDGFCDGFLLTSQPNYLPTVAVFVATFFSTRVGSSQIVTVPPSSRIYNIDRSSQYRCPSLHFDLNYYYQFNGFANAKLIAEYCNETIAASNFFLPPCQVDLTYWPTRYYRYIGHLERQSPNAGCNLLPVIYSPESYCSSSRCLTIGYNQPCNGNGNCIDAVGGGYVCKCFDFFTPNVDSSKYSLNGQPGWIGSACQFSVAEFCVRGTDGVLCSGYQTACKPKIAYVGQFFLLNFQDGLHDDYLPACDCTGLPASGQFCENTLCGLSCDSLGPGTGNCIQGADGLYSCVCGPTAIGKFCEVDSTACVYNGLSCGGRGECVINGTIASCICDPGFKNTHCQDSECDSSLMVPGHGSCTNNILSSCYPVYSGVRCEVDSCSFWGGVAISTSACSCFADLAPLLNGLVVPTCWPQCPIVNNTMCGSTAATCLQLQSGSQRSAVCQCDQQSTLNSQGWCQSRCANGLAVSTNGHVQCVCQAGWKGPECDVPICSNGGVYTNGACICPPPYTPSSMCVKNTCGSNGVVVSGINTAFQCDCSTPNAQSSIYDCLGNVCGSFGVLYPFWSYQPQEKWCVCSPSYSTSFTNGTYSYCSVLNCSVGEVAVDGVCTVPVASSARRRSGIGWV